MITIFTNPIVFEKDSKTLFIVNYKPKLDILDLDFKGNNANINIEYLYYISDNHFLE